MEAINSMFKKCAIVLCVGVLTTGTLMATTAQAARSITTKDLVHVVTVQKEKQVTKEPDLSIQIVVDTDKTLATLEEVFARTEAQDMLLPDFFGETAKEEMLPLLPEGFDLAKLVLQEMVTCSAMHYDPEFGGVSVDIAFATSFLPGQTVVAMAGITRQPDQLLEAADGSGVVAKAPDTVLLGENTLPGTPGTEQEMIEWHAMKATAQQDGLLVTFSQELLEQLSQQEDFMLGVLSEWPYTAPK